MGASEFMGPVLPGLVFGYAPLHGNPVAFVKSGHLRAVDRHIANRLTHAEYVSALSRGRHHSDWMNADVWADPII